MYTQQYGRLGALQDLGQFGKSDPSANMEDQWAAVKRANTVQGKWPIQLHYDLSTIGVYYNKDLFKKAGLPDPNAKLPEYWTFDEFRDAALKLTVDGPNGKQWGIGGRLDIFSIMAPLMETNGGGLINRDNTKTVLDKPESIEIMEQVAELYYKYKAAPTAQEAQTIPLFESGRVAMQLANPEASLRFRERIADFEWDVAPLPVSSKTKEKRNWVHGGGLTMSSATKQPEATWKFINYYMGAENLTEMVGKTARGIPGRPSIKQTLLRPDKPPKNLQLFIDAVDWATCSVVNNFDEFNKILTPASDDIYDGKRPAADVFREITPKLDALLKLD
jgi:multiple sugar transport system substrate-binding protein